MIVILNSMARLLFLALFALLVPGGFLPVLPASAAEAAAEEAEAPAEVISGTEEASPLPELVSEGDFGGELFGGRNGYVHPFLSVEEYFTDNLFDQPENEQEDFVTVISPGVWLSFPKRSRPPLQATTLNSAPGGLAVTRFPVEKRRRLQGYALYRADITEHHQFSEEDHVYQRAEGLLNYNLRGGLSLEALDIYEVEQDPYSSGLSRQLDKFTSNLLQFMANYRISPKTRVRTDFSFYSLDFDAKRNAFRERQDSIVSLYGFYRLFPKSSLLLQYDHVEIEYDQTILADSRENRLLTGLVWEVTTRTQGTAKFGYAWRSYDAGDDQNKWVGEVRLDHRFTPKTSAYLLFTRRIEETDIRQSQSILSHRLQLGYRQKLMPRLTGTADLYYYRSKYEEGLARDDDSYGARAALGYYFRPWLNLALGYSYLERNSSWDEFDYTSNTVYLTLTAAL